MSTVEDDIIEAMMRGEWYEPADPSTTADHRAGTCTGEPQQADAADPASSASHDVDAPVVRAKLLRDLLLGNILHKGLRPGPLAVRLRGMTIVGTLDLRDGGTGDAGIPPLLLSRCALPGNPRDPADWCLRADHARLSRLSLRECRVGRINLQQAKLLSKLELVDIQPADEHLPCQVYAPGIHVTGPILAERTHLWVPEQHKLDDDATVSGLALYLVGARVEGDVLLGPDFFAAGGVSVRRALINGAFYLDGDCLAAPGKIAFRADFLRCSGPVDVVFPARHEQYERRIALHPTAYFQRTISLCNADIGELDIRHLSVVGGGETGRGSLPDLDASSCSVLGDVRLIDIIEAPGSDPRTEYGISLIGAKIGGDLVIGGLRTSMIMQAARIEGRFLSDRKSESVMTPPSKKDYGLDAWGVKVGNGIGIPAFRGSLFLGHARIHGNTDITANEIFAFDAACAGFDGPVCLKGKFLLKQNKTFSLDDARIAGNLDINVDSLKATLRRVVVNGNLSMTASNMAQIDVQGANVKGLFELRGTVRSAEETPIQLAGGRYEGGLVVGPLIFRQYGHAQQMLSVSDAKIERNLTIRPITPQRVSSRLSEFVHNGATEPLYSISAPSFYPAGWRIVEALVNLEGNRSAIVSWLLNLANGDAILLDGTSTPIHDTNSNVRLVLDSPEKAIEYTRFFCFYVWGDSGSFRLIEDRQSCTQLNPSTDLDPSPASVTGGDAASGWQIEATVCYDKILFKTWFLVKPTGSIEMTNDEPVASVRADGRVSYEPPFRVLNYSPEPGDWFVAEDSIAQGEVALPRAETSFAYIRQQIDDRSSADPGSGQVEPGRLKLALTGLRANTFCYIGERSFGKGVQLDLDGFDYDRIEDESPLVAGDFEASRTAKENSADLSRQPSLSGELVRILGRRAWLLLIAVARLIWRLVAIAAAGLAGFRAFLRNLKLLATRANLARLLLSDVKDIWMSATAAFSKAWKRMFPLPRFNAAVVPHHHVLRLQYADEQRPLAEEYKPQPYEQLARVLRNHGMFGDARRVVLTKLSFERQLVHKWWAEPWQLFLEKGFKHGLFMGRGLVTFGLFWAIGALAFDIANHGKTTRLLDSTPALSWITPSIDRPVLVLDALPVLETLPIHSVELIAPHPQPSLAVRATRDANGPQVEIRCGDQADPFLYALDVMIPILDLKQENKCGISGGDHARGWRIFKVVYAILGAIVTSIVILAVSGVLRRRVET